MKKRIVTGLFTALAVMANAQSFTEWQNPEVNAVNRAPMHTNYFAYESEGVAQTYNPQIQISAESETKRSIFREKDKTKRSKKESAQHSKSRNKSFVMTSVSAL